MMRTQYILSLKDSKRPRAIGNKAQSLLFLIKKGFPVPDTWVCTWDAFVQFRSGDTGIFNQLGQELSAHADVTRCYAVRSSANVEDSERFSFAGQFRSVLNVQGLNAIIEAIKSVWVSASTQSVQSYMKKNGLVPDSIKMAVVIQEMVQPVFSGVSFSRNPITGMDETVVEAVRGTSEGLLQEGITPCRWVHKWGEWIALPEHEEIPREIIKDVVDGTREIARTFGRPLDLEWAYAGSKLYWVQLREITSLKNLNIYSNHIAKEVLPGIIKPLVWSVNVPMVNSAWKKFLTEMVGEIDLDPHALARSFYYRAYFNMGVVGSIFAALGLPPETIELLMGIYREGAEKPSFRLTPRMLMRLPRIVRFSLGKIIYAKHFPALFSAMKQNYQSFKRSALDSLSMTELLHEIDQLFILSQQTAYYNIIAQLLMGLYNTILKSQLKKLGVDFTSFDLAWGMDELKRFDPTIHILVMQQQIRQLPESVRNRITNASYEEFTRLPGIEHIQIEFDDFIERFGHLSDSGTDFSSVPWRETPEVILSMIATAPQAEHQSMRKICFVDLHMSVLRRFFLRPLYNKARSCLLYREEISLLYTYGYGLFRLYFRALAARFVQNGFIADGDDIFYLSLPEIRAIVEKGSMEDGCLDALALRKKEIEQYQDMCLPGIIYGDQPPPLINHLGNKLKGTPTSRGYYRGPVKVVKGIRDFPKVEAGSVLVIPYSDVGWTPLFTKAGALIAESGGILSHSSIIAREYNIPAVVSVAGACQIKDNTLVSVDGYLGEILIHEP
jgi:pyruvate,water dikinase